MALIIGQLRFFLASFLTGVGILFCYDFLRIFRLLLHHSEVVVVLEDFLFSIIASVVVFVMVFELNSGILRFFFVFAFLVGMYAYYLLAGNRFSRCVAGLIHKMLCPLISRLKKMNQKRKKFLKKQGINRIIKIRDKLQR